MTDNERNFIIELEQISRKYGLHIYGCGCCGSPSLEKLEDKQLVSEAGYVYENELQWVDPDHHAWDGDYWDADEPGLKTKVVGKESNES